MRPIRILIVDDHRLFRQGLVSLLDTESGFEVVGEAASGQEALRLAAERRPDVALVDLRMPDAAGARVIASLLALDPSPKAVALTASEDSGDMLAAIQAGAMGYVQKNADADVLFDAIRKVHQGGAALCDTAVPKVLAMLRSHPFPSSAALLTPREQEVLALIVDGSTNAEIARRLVISENTVKTHVSHILEKLGARNRDELIGWGYGARP